MSMQRINFWPAHSATEHRWAARLQRLSRFPIDVRGAVFRGSGPADGPLVAPVCSHLGHDLRLQFVVCSLLRVSLSEVQRQNATLLVARGTAIEPWLRQAAEMFSLPLVSIGCVKGDLAAAAEDDLSLSVCEPGRGVGDGIVTAIADRVDALYVRRRGRIAISLDRRIARLSDLPTRVAKIPDRRCDAERLWERGASRLADPVLLPPPASCRKVTPTSEGAIESDSWIYQEDQWLIHCTRATAGPWPDESTEEFREALIAGDPQVLRRTAIDALARIVTMGRLLASCRTTDHRFPVVCFSACSLHSLLQRRCFRTHLHRWDYEPFGVAIHIDSAKRLGIQPVIYGDRKRKEKLAMSDRFRFQATGSTYDWRLEREWRASSDLDLGSVPRSGLRLFAAGDPSSFPSALRDAPWRLTCLRFPPASPPGGRSQNHEKPV